VNSLYYEYVTIYNSLYILTSYHTRTHTNTHTRAIQLALYTHNIQLARSHHTTRSLTIYHSLAHNIQLARSHCTTRSLAIYNLLAHNIPPSLSCSSPSRVCVLSLFRVYSQYSEYTRKSDIHSHNIQLAVMYALRSAIYNSLAHNIRLAAQSIYNRELYVVSIYIAFSCVLSIL